VYYTPTYIVDYIVQQTVGKLVEGKRPGPRGAVSKLRILDPACGSGSFLLGAYQFLLDWHLKEYLTDGADKHLNVLAQGPGGAWRLSTQERKRILLNNIYGVDIDAQAVETTKLSLLLKVLEGESEETLGRQLGLFHERALPDLGNNIKSGNSLIGPDFYDGEQIGFLGEEERYRINAFDWEAEFPEIMRTGGFDAVIGNPPYGASFSEAEKAYIRKRYRAYRYKYDSYIYFIEAALRLAKSGGWISYITPEVWLRLENSAAVRELIAQDAGFGRLRVLGENVFRDAVVSTVVFVLQRGMKSEQMIVETDGGTWLLPSERWKQSGLYTIDYRVKPGTDSVLGKLAAMSVPLSTFGEAVQGITSYDKYRGHSPELIKSRAFHSDHQRDHTYGKWLAGKDVNRYTTGWSGEWLSYGSWLAAPRESRFFAGPRLLFREVPGKGKRIQAAVAEEVLYHGHSITPFKLSDGCTVSALYLLGVVNSQLVSWYASLMLPNFGKDVFPKLNPQDIKQLPIRTTAFSDPTERTRHDRMVSLVERMLTLHQQTAEKTGHDKTLIGRQIEATDRQIDRLVYELYGLTEEEIGIVEGRETISGIHE
jgi:hypothetical protein